MTSVKKCPTEQSRIDFDINIGVSKEVETEFQAHPENEDCPKAIVKFTPPIFNRKCHKEFYQNFTSIGYFDTKVRFEKVRHILTNFHEGSL